MAIPRGYEPLRRKKSKAPWVWLLLLVVFLGLFYYKRKQIFLFFARDQSVRTEKAKDKTVELWKNGQLTPQVVEDFQQAAQLFSEKDPLDPQSFHLLARSQYWALELAQIHFDAKLLLEAIGGDLRVVLDEELRKDSPIESIYWNAVKAEALGGDDFQKEPNNRVLIFLGETYRLVKKPEALLKEYSNIDPKSLSAELVDLNYWLLLYSIMKAGDADLLEQFLAETKKPEFLGKLRFQEREETFLKGIGKFYKKDYVTSLNYLRAAKTDKMDSITIPCLLLEAQVFHRQNLSQKALDLLEESYLQHDKKHPEFLVLAQKILSEKPNLKTRLERKPEEKK